MNQQMLSMSNAINNRDDEGNTPLMLACKHNKFSIVKSTILSPTVNLHDTNIYGDTILHIAIKNGNDRLVKFLLKHNIDTTLPNNNNDTPIKLVFKESNINNWTSMCKALLTQSSHKLDLNFDIFDCLTFEKSNVRQTTRPLIWACRSLSTNIVKLMLKHNVDINFTLQDGTNALYYALFNNVGLDFNLVKFLVKQGADISNNNCILNECYQEFDSESLFKLLINDKTDVNKKDNESKTPLMRLIESKHIKIDNFKSIFNNLVNNRNILLDMTDDNGNNALHYAINDGPVKSTTSNASYTNKPLNNNNYIHKQLLGYDIDNHFNTKNYAIQQLLKTNININAQNSEGNTPLHLAYRFGKYHIARLLLERGANPNIHNNAQQLPIDTTK